MRQIFTLIILLSFGSNTSHAQLLIPPYKQPYKKKAEFKGDTLNYLVYNFEDNKTAFMGKPLKELINLLEYDIGYIRNSIIHSNRHIIPSICLYIADRNTVSSQIHNRIQPIFMIITFKQPAPADSASILSIKNKQKWTKDEYNFYGTREVSNVEVYGKHKREITIFTDQQLKGVGKK